jgi:catechol 2,3-dioxygenase-like lactoylglutathione lyase family enzyme
MPDHTFLTVNDIDRSIALYEQVLSVLGITVDFTGDFGHEIGLLALIVGGDRRMTRVDANLE